MGPFSSRKEYFRLSSPPLLALLQESDAITSPMKREGVPVPSQAQERMRSVGKSDYRFIPRTDDHPTDRPP